MMSRKDYIATSEILNEFVNNAKVVDNDDFEELLVNKFADYFKNDNPNFNPERFWDACFAD